MTLPPLSRTARLCPLFSSISSLYIPELWMDLSGVTPEAHGAPIPCQEKRVHSLQSALLAITTKPALSKLKLTAIFKRTKKPIRAVFEAQHSLPQLKLHRRYPHWLKCLIQLSNFSRGVTTDRKLHASSFLPSDQSVVELIFFPFLCNSHFYCSSITSAETEHTEQTNCITSQPNTASTPDIDAREDQCF